MKIVSQSIVVPSVPYVHLGYLSATYSQPQPTLLGGGLVGLVLGVALMYSLVAGKSAAGLTNFKFVRRQSKKMVAAGAVLLVLGGAAVALAIAYTKTAYQHPDTVTQAHGYHLLGVVKTRQEQGVTLPAAMDAASLGVEEKLMMDGWFRPMRLEKVGAEGSTYQVRSAGRDGAFGTGDDVVINGWE